MANTAPDKHAIDTASAPKAVASYSQGIIANGFIFTSGQIALDPASGELVGADVAAQARRVLENVTAVLEAAGSSLDHVVKANVYLRDMNDFAAMNAVYAEYFDPGKRNGPLPARTTVQATLPRNAIIEIDVVALVPIRT